MNITTEEEYLAALDRVDELFDIDDGPEVKELDDLVDAIIAWEDEHYNWDDEYEGF